jgi:hypothetical protein
VPATQLADDPGEDPARGFRLASAFVDVAPKVDQLAKLLRLIEKHAAAFAADLEALDADGGR